MRAGSRRVAFALASSSPPPFLLLAGVQIVEIEADRWAHEERATWPTRIFISEADAESNVDVKKKRSFFGQFELLPPSQNVGCV